MKSEVYSWRLAPETKQALEQRARDEGLSLAELLERIVGAWLEERRAGEGPDAQARMRAAALRCFGVLSRGEPATGAAVRQKVKRRLEERRARRRPA